MREIKAPKFLIFSEEKVARLVSRLISWNRMTFVSLVFILTFSFLPLDAAATEVHRVTPGNFGLPGIVDLPTARRFPDGELVVTQQLHRSLARSGISFQALPRVGVSFRYTGHGINGKEAYGRTNHDRSFDAHISILDEGLYFPAISLGLRDFIGTGWYSSEYIVGSKSIGKLEMTAGLGFGRLAGRDTFTNPLNVLSSRFNLRDNNNFGRGGTLGTINWFQGDAASFYGIKYQLGQKATLLAEYTPDLMLRESSYLNLKSPWNVGVSYQLNDYFNLSAQYLHGSQISFTGNVTVNPGRPPLLGGKELAPVPMRLRDYDALPVEVTDEILIRKVLGADRFKIHKLGIEGNTIKIIVTNFKFRSVTQAIGRVASTLQRFTSDEIQFAHISFSSRNLKTATYQVDLQKIGIEQFSPVVLSNDKPSVEAVDVDSSNFKKNSQRFTWGLGPYIEHRLFNPDLPLSMELGLEIDMGFQLATGLKISGAVRKSALTNLTENKRLDSGSQLPRVHSSWPLYDLAGQDGHIHRFKISYLNNIAPGLFGRAHVGLLGPYFAGVGGEILYKPAQWPIGLGLDIHRVRQRNYDMLFDLQDYETTVGHFSIYYDAGDMFDIELNAGRYLAGDWGATTTISRKFGSGWEVGGYATLTDVPFDVFGEGSFDKAIFVSIPIDWITSSPNRTKRRLTLRPITRDGGAQLSSARNLYRLIEDSQNANFKREFGRLWK